MNPFEPQCDDHERRLKAVEVCQKELNETAKDIKENHLPHIESKLAVLNERAGWLKWLLIAMLGLRGLGQAKEWLGW